MNYRKSLLSLVALLALSGTASADSTAKYLPLTNATNDSSWILFGVNGFSSGVASPFGTTASAFSPNFTQLVETDTTDNLETSGMTSGSGDLVSLLALQDQSITALSIGIDISGIPYEAKEPVRSMYAKVGSSTQNVKIDYKASLEGKRVEFFINDTGVLYSSTLSQNYTYANAATAIVDTLTTSSYADEKDIVDVLDMNSSNNPIEPMYFSSSSHLDAVGAAPHLAVFYHFDSVSQQWKVWNNTYSGVSNDFTAFSQGDAYWGRVDVNDTTNNDSGATTLILGTSGDSDGIPDASVYTYDDNVTSKLTTGWNMLALDDIKPYVRHAATGMIVTSTGADGNVTITDSTGVHSVMVDLVGANAELQAKQINIALESAKLLGTVPTTFNVKAFRGNAATQLLFISDAKFTLLDNNDSALTAATTLTGANPYNELGFNTAAIADINDTRSATSVYGEYTLLMKPLVGDASADSNTSVNVGFSKVAFGTAATGDHATIALTQVASTIADIVTPAQFPAAAAAADTTGEFVPTVSSIDTDFDGVEDMIIVAEPDTPFYVKDKTYSRVFTVDNTDFNASAYSINIDGTVSAAVAPPADDNASDIAADINALAATTDVYAGHVGATTLVALSTVDNVFDINDVEDGTVDFLANTTSTNDVAKGAISGVYALDTLARTDMVQHTWEATDFTFPGIPGDVNLSVDINLTGTVTNMVIDINTTMSGDATVAANRLAFFDALVAALDLNITSAGAHAYAYHDYNSTLDNLATATVTVIGMDVKDVNGTMTSALATFTDFVDDAQAETFGTFASLIGDLKSNAIHSPNFAEYGPLYTMREAGYDVRAILKAETAMTDSSIVWDGIDLTRDEDDWFLNNEFNLFGANLHSGYWLYLETAAADTVVISTPSFSGTYEYYFDNDNDLTTTNNITIGQLTVNITGLNTTTSSAFVTIGGQTIELKRNGTSDEYTADITSYSMTSFNQDDTGPIEFTVRATNGKGEAVKTLSGTFSYDFGAPTVSAPTFPNVTSVTFTSDENTTTFHLFKEFIPEYDSNQSNQLVSTYATTTGSASTNICESLTYGDVDTLRVVAADGTGVLGSSNVSDAQEFVYATMIQGAMVLTDIGGDTTKAIIGTRYDSTCTQSATQPALPTDNTGVSLKTITGGAQTAYLSYKEEAVAVNDLSGAYTQTWELPDGTDIIQVQNLNEYAGDRFFVEYAGTLYYGTFASADLEATEALTEITGSSQTLQP